MENSGPWVRTVNVSAVKAVKNLNPRWQKVMFSCVYTVWQSIQQNYGKRNSTASIHILLFDSRKIRHAQTCCEGVWTPVWPWDRKSYFFFLYATIHWFFLKCDNSAAPNQLSPNMMDSLVKKSIRDPTEVGDGGGWPSLQYFMMNL